MTENSFVHLLQFIPISGVIAIASFFWIRAIYGYVDTNDLTTGLFWIWFALVVAFAAIVVYRQPVVGFAALVAFTTLMFLFFKSETIGGDYLVVKKRGHTTTPWKGPGTYLIGRYATTSTANADNQTVMFFGDDAINALSADAIKMKVQLAVTIAHKLDGTAEGTAKAAAEKAAVAESKALIEYYSLYPTYPDGTPVADPSDATALATLNDQRAAALTAWQSAQVEAARTAHVRALVEADPAQVKKDDEAYRKAVVALGDGDRVKNRAKGSIDMAARQAVGQFFAMDAATTGREALRAMIQTIVTPILVAMKYEVKGVLLGPVEPDDIVRTYEQEMQNWIQLEESMGPTGLAKHVADRLADAGIVLLPTGPATMNLPANGQIPPTPAPATGTIPGP